MLSSVGVTALLRSSTGHAPGHLWGGEAPEQPQLPGRAVQCCSSQAHHLFLGSGFGPHAFSGSFEGDCVSGGLRGCLLWAQPWGLEGAAQHTALLTADPWRGWRSVPRSWRARGRSLAERRQWWSPRAGPGHGPHSVPAEPAAPSGPGAQLAARCSRPARACVLSPAAVPGGSLLFTPHISGSGDFPLLFELGDMHNTSFSLKKVIIWHLHQKCRESVKMVTEFIIAVEPSFVNKCSVAVIPYCNMYGNNWV